MDTSKSGGRNPLVDAAAGIDVFAGAGRDRELDALRGEKVADRWEDDPRLQDQRPVAADPEQGVEASNPEGSYEQFLMLMGGGMRPAMDLNPGANGSGDG